MFSFEHTVFKFPGETQVTMSRSRPMSQKHGRVIWVGETDLEVILHGAWEIDVIVVNDTSQGGHA